MPYIRKEISKTDIERQKEICQIINNKVNVGKEHPLAMVDTYGCQQNEADSEKIKGGWNTS